MILTAFYFALFFVGFLVSEIVRFQYYLIRYPKTGSTLLLIMLIAMISGASVFEGIKRLKLLPLVWWKRVALGGAFGVFWFGGIFIIEDHLSTRKLHQDYKVENFANLSGHCGLQVGRTLSSKISTPIENWKIRDRCRVAHWASLEQRGLLCKGSYVCVLNVMRSFGEKGNWSLIARRYFIDELLRDQSIVDSTDNLQSFFQIDQELVKSSKPWFKQAEIDEEFNADFTVIQIHDELEHLKLTQKIYNKILEIPADKLNPSLSDLVKQTSIQIEKIPTLQSDFERLRN